MWSTGQQTINKHRETQANLSYFTCLLGWGSHVRFGGGRLYSAEPPFISTHSPGEFVSFRFPEIYSLLSRMGAGAGV